MHNEPNFRIKLIGGMLDGERFPIYSDSVPVNIGLTFDENLQKDYTTEHFYQLHFKMIMKNDELDCIEMSYKYVGPLELSDEIKEQMRRFWKNKNQVKKYGPIGE